MPKSVVIKTEYEPIPVELWGHTFETVEVTKSLRKELAPFQDKWENADDDEEILAAVGFALDKRLKSTDAKRLKPSALFRKKYDANEVSVARVLGIVAQIGEADLLPS